MPTDLCQLDAVEIARRVRSREVSAAEVLAAHLQQIDELDGQIGSVWLTMRERAEREAGAVDAAVARGEDPGPLAGVPVGWKDLIDTGGTRTTYGSRLFESHVPDTDADVVSALTAAGAINVAKLSLHELAWGTTNNNPHFGPCHNPYDLTRVPGGSSGGSAAALAAELVALAPGTDTGGSIRCPASCCAIVGLKPTYGRVSLAGIYPLCHSLDHCGPMARSVRDCAVALEVMAGPSPRDPRTPPVPIDDYTGALERGVEGMVIGLIEEFFELTAPPIQAAVRDCAAVLERAGAKLVPVELNWSLAPDSAEFYGPEQTAVVYAHWPQGRDLVGRDVARDVDASLPLKAIDYALARAALVDYAVIARRQIDEAGADLLLCPTEAFLPPEIGRERISFGGREDIEVTIAMCTLTEPFDMLGWPAISVPAGLIDGLPVGCQIIGRPWREADCLAAAAALERGVPSTRPPLLAAEPPAGAAPGSR